MISIRQLKMLAALAAIILAFGAATGAPSAQASQMPTAAQAATANAMRAFDLSPALFVENRGQWDESIRYAFDGKGTTVSFTDAGPVFQTADSDVKADGSRSETTFAAHFAGARTVRPVAMDPAATHVNFYQSDDATKWQENIPAFTKIAYPGIYDGVDLYMWGTRSGIKYEFHVAPGASWDHVVIRYEGIKCLSLDDSGALHIKTADGEMVDKAPYIYQETPSGRVGVAAHYKLVDDCSYRFEITGAYDLSLPLVLDPDLSWDAWVESDYGFAYGSQWAIDSAGNCIFLYESAHAGLPTPNGAGSTTGGPYLAKVSPSGQVLWGTYIGSGSSPMYASILDLAIDPSDNVIVSGECDSSGMPILNAFQSSYGGGGSDGYAAKFTSAGQLSWATYLGGSGFDDLDDIKVDPSGNITICGYSDSTNFPAVTKAISEGAGSSGFVVRLTSSGQPSWDVWVQSDYGFGSGNNQWAVDSAGNCVFLYDDANPGLPTPNGTSSTVNGPYLVKVSPLGQVLWGTYVGKSSSPTYASIDYLTLDSSDSVIICGRCEGSGMPIVNAFQGTYGGGEYDGYAAKFASSGQLSWATYLGGSGYDRLYYTQVDRFGNITITGYSDSTNFPAVTAAISEGTGGRGFAVRLTSSGQPSWDAWIASDYGFVGSNQWAADSAGNSVFLYRDASAGLPTPNGTSSTTGGPYLAKVSPSGQVLWGTYVGSGGAPTYGSLNGLAIDPSDNVIVCGHCEGSGMPILNAFQSNYGGGELDGYAAKFTSTGQLSWATYLGGSDDDSFDSMKLDRFGNITITGRSYSTNFPAIPRAISESATSTGFVVRIDASAAALAVGVWSLPDGSNGRPYSQTLSAYNGTGPYSWAIVSGALPAGLTLVAPTGAITGTATATGTASFTVRVTDGTSATATRALSININPAPVVSTSSLPAYTIGFYYHQTLSATGGTAPLTFSVQAGALPAGLSLDSDWPAITGTPTATGTASFTIAVTDSAGASGTKALSIVINPRPAISTASLPATTVGAAYSQTLAGTGGTGSLIWDFYSGSLPPGLSLTAATGAITGTSLGSGTCSFAMRVTDTLGASATKSLSIAVSAAPAIETESLPMGEVSLAYSQTLIATGGIAPLTWSLPAGSVPAGLSLSSSAGTITGTPTASGTASFTARASDSVGASASRALSIAIVAQLTVTTASLPDDTVNHSYYQTLSVSGGATLYGWSLLSGSLPAGLSLNGNGYVFGVPTATGTSNFAVKALDELGASATKAFSIVINPALAITTTTLPYDTANIAYDQSLTATGGTPPLTWSMKSGSLPHGLTLTSAGAITGTPTFNEYDAFTVQVTDHAACTATKALSITVHAPVSIYVTTLPDWTVGVAYNKSLQVSGGTGALTCSIAGGSLPAGLTITSPGGVISGTPTASGAADITVRAVDTLGSAATRAYSFAINPQLSVGTSSLPAGTFGAQYDQHLLPSGGTSPYTWSRESGSLPTGLTLYSGGAMSGTPNYAATFTFVAKVVDYVGATATKSLSIPVYSTPTITTLSLADGTVGWPYNQSLSAAGVTGSVTWSLAGGSLPAGLSLVGSTGAITGTPTAGGESAFSIRVTDSLSATGTAAFSIKVYQPLSITTASLPAGKVGVAYSSQVSSTGGVAPCTWSVAAGSLPAGLSLGAATGVISGTPTSAGLASFTIGVSDSHTPHNTATKALSIAVGAGEPTYQVAANDSETSTTSTGYVNKVTLSFTPGAADDWIIFGFCEFKCPNVNYAGFVQLFIDGTGEGQNTRKPVDPTDYMPFITVKVKNLNAAPHTIQLMFKTGGSSAPAYVRNARICAVRKGSLEFVNVARDSGVGLTSALQDIVTLNWTPGTTGNYLVISTAEINATTTVSTDLQTFYNGTLNDEGIIRAADNGDFTTFMSFNYLANAPGGVPIAHKIAAKKAAADTANHYVRRARILALRLSGGRFKYAAIGSGTEQSTVQTAFHQALSTTWTQGVNGKWLFLNSARVNNSSTSCQTEVRVQLNDSVICGQQLMKPKDIMDLLNYSSIDIRSLTTPRMVDMDFRTTNLSGTAKVKRLRFYGLPLDAQ